ncbi:MAG: HAMP domain-containing histidine kinase [Proteobacteria bacterium]|nr:HAMP domain-containing histidine kinase [Pseudomonadota bacterium]
MEVKAGRVRFTGAPIALQIMALLLAAVVVANGLSFLIVVLLPPPRPAIWRVTDVAAALKGGPLQTREGRTLVRRIAASPPRPKDPDRRGGPQHMALAQELGLPPDKVSVVESRPPQRFSPAWIGGPALAAREFEHHHGGQKGDDHRPGPPGDGPQPPNMMFDNGGGDRPPPPRDPAADPGPGPAGAPPGGAPEGERRFNFVVNGPGGLRAFDRMPLIGDFSAAAQMPDGRWLVVSTPPEPFPNAWQLRVLLWLAACLVVIGLAGFLFSRRITAPIRAFAEAAEHLGRDPRQGAIPLSGSAEIGKAAAAFNRMQERLKRYVDDRTAMVAAISHDLRTPLARIRFKVEDAPDEMKAAVVRDIERMEDMIGAVLAFIRDGAEASHRERLDLRSVIEVAADDAAALGVDVPVTGEDRPIIVDGDPSALTRLFGNIVDNALKYGQGAEARVFQADDHGIVEVVDTGPGLSPSDMERVFEPFFRSDPARTLTDDGVGLGLAVARSIARAHGGDIVMRPNSPTGLIVRVSLPLAASR